MTYASNLYRIAAVLLVLFAAGHTMGFLTFAPPTVESRAVLDAMHTVRFSANGGNFTFYGFYAGFGLFVSAYLLFASLVAWHLAGMARRAPEAIGGLGWSFFAVQLACLVLSRVYFFAAPVAFSALITVCAGVAAWLVRSAPAPLARGKAA